MAVSLQNLDCFECSVCMEPMLDKRPIMLPCMHTFCTPCIKKLHERAPLACPTCRRRINVPGDDVDKLPVNFELVKIMEQVTNLSAPKETPENACESCLRKGERHQAVSFCVDCKRKICQLCIDKHKEIPVFGKHQMVSQRGENICSKHGEVLQYICAECLEALCIDCTNTDSHKGHLERIELLKNGTCIAELRAGHAQVTENVDEHIKEICSINQSISYDVHVVNTSKRDLNDLRECLLRKVAETDNLLKQVSGYEASIRKAEAEVKQLGERALLHQHILKTASEYSDIQFLDYVKKRSLDLSYLEATKHMRKSLQEYQLPKFVVNACFTIENLSNNEVGQVKEIPSHGKIIDNATDCGVCATLIAHELGKCIFCGLTSNLKCSACNRPVCRGCFERQKHFRCGNFPVSR